MNLKRSSTAVFLLVLLAGCGKNSQPPAASPPPSAASQAPAAAQPASAVPTETAKIQAEIKAILAKIQEAVKAGNTEEAKKFISKDFLSPDQQGAVMTCLSMLANAKFDRIEPEGEVVLMSAGGLSTVMAKEDGQWKFIQEEADPDPADPAAATPAAAPTEEIQATLVPSKAQRNTGGQYGCLMKLNLTCTNGILLSIDMLSAEITSCKDDTGKELGSKKRDQLQGTASIASVFSPGSEFIVNFIAKEQPAEAATSVSLTAIVEGMHGAEKTVRKDTLKLARGNKGFFAGRPMRVKGHKQEKDFFSGKPVTVYELVYRSSRPFEEQALGKVTFSGPSGKEIEGKIEGGGRFISPEKATGTVHLKLSEAVPEVTISYEEVVAQRKKIPVNVSFPIQK